MHARVGNTCISVFKTREYGPGGGLNSPGNSVRGTVFPRELGPGGTVFPKGIRSAGPKIWPDRIPYDTGRVSTIYSIMVKMAAPATEHCSKAPRTRKIYVMEKNKWHENMYQCAANHNKGWQLNFSLRFNFKKTVEYSN